MGTGNTLLFCRNLAKFSVHPRGHGEHAWRNHRQLYAGRFIPVGTGNTSGVCIDVAVQAVHPRGHGEHFEWAPTEKHATGSSPWARGTLQVFNGQIADIRFIPVGTGNTSKWWGRAGILPVHPRGHGEHKRRLNQSCSHNGSSPWARGTHRGISGAGISLRFIPVGTGNTEAGRADIHQRPVHPRGHGEHLGRPFK